VQSQGYTSIHARNFGSISTNLPSHPSPIDANAFLQADRSKCGAAANQLLTRYSITDTQDDPSLMGDRPKQMRRVLFLFSLYLYPSCTSNATDFSKQRSKC